VQIPIVRVQHRQIGRQVQARRHGLRLLEQEQAGLAAACQHKGAAADLAANQMPSRGLAIGLHGRARIEPQRPGQPALRRQAIAWLEFAALDCRGDRIHQRQIARLIVIAKLRKPHCLPCNIRIYPYNDPT